MPAPSPTKATFRNDGLPSRLVFVCACLLLFAQFALAERLEQLRPTNYLNDFAGVVDMPTAERINALAAEVQQKTGAQIAVVTVRTLEGAEAPDYANRLFKQWGIGDKQRDRGVLVLVATRDHKYWTEVGYGLEPILPDGKVGGFGREMVPSLRENRYSDALLLITTRIAQTIAADAGVTLTTEKPATTPEPGDGTSGPHFSVSLLVILLLIFFFVLPALLGRRRSGCSGCLFPFLLSGGGFGGGWGGGSSWGGFGGGSSGGGFGGFGGGSSGGGGAGGSW